MAVVEPLKTCPFCGGEPILNDPGGSAADCYDITVRCLDCDAEVAGLVDQDSTTDGGAETKAEVIEHWNRRILPADHAAAVQAEREACAAGLDAAANMLRLRDAEDRGIPDHMGHSFEANAAEAWAKSIRARGDASALAAAEARAEARGEENAIELIAKHLESLNLKPFWVRSVRRLAEPAAIRALTPSAGGEGA